MGVDQAIEERLTLVIGKGIRWKAVARPAEGTEISAMRERLRRTTEVSRLDTSDLPKDAVANWFQSLSIPEEAIVTVIWPHYQGAIDMQYVDFVKFYDDLWYPSADDVWIADASGSWMLELNHEEVFTLRRAP